MKLIPETRRTPYIRYTSVATITGWSIDLLVDYKSPSLFIHPVASSQYFGDGMVFIRYIYA